MIAVTFASLMPNKPHHGQGFYFNGEYKGYIGTDADGVPFVFYKRSGFGKGVYEFHATISACYHAIRCLATRLAWKASWRIERTVRRDPQFASRTLTQAVRSGRPVYPMIDGDLQSEYLHRVLATPVLTTISPRSVPAPLARNVVRALPLGLSTTTDRASFFRSATYPQPLTLRNT